MRDGERPDPPLSTTDRDLPQRNRHDCVMTESTIAKILSGLRAPQLQLIGPP